MSVSGTGRPFSSSTRPATTMRSPSGSPRCCFVRSSLLGPRRWRPPSGPVASESVGSMAIGASSGARFTVEP